MDNVHIQVVVTSELREKFKEAAKKNAHNPSQLIRLWIEQYIEECGKND